MILQPGRGRINSDCYLPVTPQTSRWGWWPDRAAEPVMAVDDGAVVTVDTLSHEGIMEDQGRDPVGFFGAHGVEPAAVLDDAVTMAAEADHRYGIDGAHVVTGPIEVQGAEPGDLLRVDVLGLAMRVPYGVTSNRHGLGALPGEMPDGTAPAEAVAFSSGHGTVSVFTSVEGSGPEAAAVLRYRPEGSGAEPEPAAAPGWSEDAGVEPALAPGWPEGEDAGAESDASGYRPEDSGGEGAVREIRYPVAPFLGMMGVAPDADGPVPSRPPGRHGGNLDVKWLTVGSALYLPVQVPGALFATGDPHFAQGNGEVALTALEGSLRADLRLSVLRGPAARQAVGLIENPLAETDDAWIPIGLHADLDEAMRAAVREALRFCRTRLGLPGHIAYAYLSAAADFEVSQVVNDIKGVHCRIRKRDFPGC